MASDAEEILNDMETYMNPGLARVFRFMGLEKVEDRAIGATLWDQNEDRYLDFGGGYGVFNQGYSHPHILAQAHAQLDKMPLSSRVLVSEPAVALAKKLAEITPGDLQYSFFANSGAEAIEAALKFARLATKRTTIIATEGAFHGKTYGALSVSGRELYKAPFRPLLPDVKHVPYGDIDALQTVMHDEVAAVLVEPVQGEGGIIVPPADYLMGIRSLCDQFGAAMIVDEVATGLGRTGKLFAIEHSGIVPDLLILAKALSGGVIPIGAVIGRPWVWKFFSESPLLHTSTFGGNPLAATVAQAAIDVTLSENLPEEAERKGRFFFKGLLDLQAKFPQVIKEVRGLGLMLGIELYSEGLSGAFMNGLFAQNLLAVYTLNNPCVVRFTPPLVVTDQELAEALRRIEGALATFAEYAEELL